jgi:hypothetical protein
LARIVEFMDRAMTLVEHGHLGDGFLITLGEAFKLLRRAQEGSVAFNDPQVLTILDLAKGNGTWETSLNQAKGLYDIAKEAASAASAATSAEVQEDPDVQGSNAFTQENLDAFIKGKINEIVNTDVCGFIMMGFSELRELVLQNLALSRVPEILHPWLAQKGLDAQNPMSLVAFFDSILNDWREVVAEVQACCGPAQSGAAAAEVSAEVAEPEAAAAESKEDAAPAEQEVVASPEDPLVAQAKISSAEEFMDARIDQLARQSAVRLLIKALDEQEAEALEQEAESPAAAAVSQVPAQVPAQVSVEVQELDLAGNVPASGAALDS